MNRTYQLDTSHATWNGTRWEVASDNLEDRLDGPFGHHFVAVDGLGVGQTYNVDIRFSGSSEFKSLTTSTPLDAFVTIGGMRIDAFRVTPGTGTNRTLVLQSVPIGFE
jgi:hypothetical protein